MMEPAVEALFWAIEKHQLQTMAGETLALRARADARLPCEGLLCEQSFKPWAEQLERSGQRCVASQELMPNTFDRIWFLPTRARAESRGQLARAVKALAPEGILIAAMANDDGARSLQSDIEALFGTACADSKSKARVIWASKQQINVELAAQWQAGAKPQQIEHGFWSRPGLFAWDRIDSASALLVRHLPKLAGRGADLGAGFGYLAHEVLRGNTNVTGLDCFEAEWHALELAKLNLKGFPGVDQGFYWHDVARGLPSSGYDFVISNPPFHQGRADLPELGLQFIEAASKALKVGGRFILVANQHLPYEAALRRLFASGQQLALEGGFKVIEAIK